MMIAFACEWVSGEIRRQESEIEEAKWFEVLQLPRLPSKISIARRLIDGEVARMIEQGKGTTGV
jgi:NAD+ diphosphatase